VYLLTVYTGIGIIHRRCQTRQNLRLTQFSDIEQTNLGIQGLIEGRVEL